MSKKITLAVSDLADGDIAKMRSFTYTDGDGTETTVKILATDAVTIPAAPAIPDISVASPADGGTASGTFDVLTGLAVDGTDKHQLNPTKKSVTLPTVSGYTGTLTVIVGWETVADGTTDRMKLKTREFTFASGLLKSIGAEVSTQWFVATPHVAEHPGGL